MRECISHTHSLLELGVVRLSLSKHLKLQCLGQKLQEKASSLFFQLGTPSPSVYLGRHWRHSRDKIGPGLPPIRFCKLHMYKWSKTGQWEGLGTRLSKAYHHTICWENRWQVLVGGVSIADCLSYKHWTRIMSVSLGCHARKPHIQHIPCTYTTIVYWETAKW